MANERKFKTLIKAVDTSYNPPSQCGDISFINKSLIDTVKVNGFPIDPGQSLNIGCESGELNTTNYQLSLPVPNDPNTFWIIAKIFE